MFKMHCNLKHTHTLACVQMHMCTPTLLFQYDFKSLSFFWFRSLATAMQKVSQIAKWKYSTEKERFPFWFNSRICYNFIWHFCPSYYEGLLIFFSFHKVKEQFAPFCFFFFWFFTVQKETTIFLLSFFISLQETGLPKMGTDSSRT